VVALRNLAAIPPQALRTQPAQVTLQAVFPGQEVRLPTQEPLPTAAVHRAPQAALGECEAQATTSVLRHTAAAQNAPLALLPTEASVMIIARAVRGARTNLVAARLAHDIGVRRFVALAVPIITLASRIIGREASGPAWRAAGDGSTPAIVGHGFIEALGPKAEFLHRR
jgi:hypothetical protein